MNSPILAFPRRLRCQIAYREVLLTNTLGLVAFLIAVVDVATSVFGVKL
jgi:hypothetical protein